MYEDKLQFFYALRINLQCLSQDLQDCIKYRDVDSAGKQCTQSLKRVNTCLYYIYGIRMALRYAEGESELYCALLNIPEIPLFRPENAHLLVEQVQKIDRYVQGLEEQTKECFLKHER